MKLDKSGSYDGESSHICQQICKCFLEKGNGHQLLLKQKQ